MAYTNSSLVSYTKLSPNHSGQRNHVIDTISIHCVVGQCSVETLGNIFAPTSRQASCNYGIGSDGRIGLYVEEKNRSWCTSSSSNDNRAVTIEVASDTTAPYAVRDVVYQSLLNLVTDICKRNGIKKLLWKGDKSLIGQVDKQNMTVHRWFANKSCPGDYLYNKHSEIAAEVIKRLGATTSTGSTSSGSTSSTSSKIKAGDTVTFISNAKQWSGSAVPQSYISKNYTVKEISSAGRAVLCIGSTVMYAANVNQLKLVKSSGSSSSSSSSSYLVKVTTSALNIRKGPGTTYSTNGCIRDYGTYTITETQGNWGKLKSGAGRICLDYTKRV